MSLHPRRSRAQKNLVDVFLDLHRQDTDYFKMYEKYGVNIEKSIFNQAIKETKKLHEPVSWDNPKFKERYAKTFRRVKANLTRTPAAPGLIRQLKEKIIQPTSIPGMTYWEMSPEYTKERVDKITEMFKLDHWNPDARPKMAPRKSGMYSCGKCKSFDIEIRTRQTRGADEPETVFATCTNCGNRWRM